MQDFIFDQSTVRRSILFLSLLFLMLSCSKEETATRDYPRFITKPVTGITSTGGTFSAEILSGDLSGVTEYGFCWDYYSDPKLISGDSLVIKGSLSGNFSNNVESLRSDSHYYLRSFIRTKKELVFGNKIEFRTLK